jgi:hypothetical protein
MRAPRSVIFFIGADHGHARRSSTNYRRHKIDRSTKPWRPRDSIPSQVEDRRELQRRVDEFRRATEPQARALRKDGLALRVAAHVARTGVPFIPWEAA